LSCKLNPVEDPRSTAALLDERFRFLADTIPQLVWTATPDGNVDYYNQRWLDYTGLTFEQTRDLGWKAVVHPDDLQLCVEHNNRKRQTGEPSETELRLRRASDGSYRWHLARSVCMRDQAGQIVRWVGTSTDIHDEKMIQSNLEKSRDELESIAELSACLIYVRDITVDKIVYVNRAVAEFHGLRAEQMLGRSFDFVRSIYHPDDLDGILAVKNRIADLADGQVLEYTARCRHASGEWRSLWNRQTVFRRLLDGQPSHIMGTAQDITSLVKTQEELRVAKELAEEHRESAEKFQQLVDGAKDYAIFMLDNQGLVQSWNSGARRLKGYSREEIIGKHFAAFYPAEDLAAGKPQKELEIATSTGKYEEDGWRVRKDGSQFFANVVIEPMRDQTGQQVGFSKITRDLTERKLAEEQFRASDMKVRAIYESAFQFIGLLDPTGVVLEANATALSFINCPLSEVRGKLFWDTPWWNYCPQEQARCRDAVQRAAAGETIRLYAQHRGKSGEVIDIDFSLKPIRDPAGRITHLIPEGRDVTELRQAQRQAAAAREIADAANRAKSEFLANMSHEIRTPMTAILGYTNLLERPNLTPKELADHVRVIRRNGEHLLQILTDILDVTKIEAGGMTIETLPCNLPQILTEIEELMRPRAEEKGIGFTLEYQSRLPRFILTDPTRLRQILLNLIGNAIKFTDTGGVRITVSQQMTNAQLSNAQLSNAQASLQIDILDTGIGISVEQQANLFRPFGQADASMARRFGGSGLGLVICKKMAEMLGGELSFVSTIGQGSTFTLRLRINQSDTEQNLPASASPATSCAQTSTRSLRGKILVAEDSIDTARLVTMLLEDTGLTVQAVSNGQQAIDAVIAARAIAQPFDAVLMDMQMPILDGYAATLKLREMGFGKLPILAFTAHAMLEEHQRCIQCGCNDCIGKPIDPKVMFEILARHLQPSNATPDAKIQSTRANNRLVRLMLVDYIAGLPAHVATLCDSLAAGDLDTLQFHGHQLKGSGGSYGFADITHLAGLVEASIFEHQPIEQVDGYDRALEIPVQPQHAAC
jgi:PAS domain S-box-containing protein